MNIQTFHYFLSSLLTSLTTLILAFFVYSRNPKSQLFRLFTFYTLSISAWSLPFAFMAYAPTERSALILGHGFHFGVTFIAIFFLHFVLVLLNVDKNKIKIIMKPLYIVAVIFTVIVPTKWHVSGVTPKFGLNYFVNPGPVYFPYVIFWAACVIYGMYKLFKGYVLSIGERRNQLKYLFFGSFIGYFTGPANFLLVFDIKYPFYPLGTYGIPIYAIVTAYAILRYRLMDINIVLTRTGIFIAVYTLVLGVPFALAFWFKSWLIALFGSNWWILPLVLMAVLATVGPFIYIYLEHKAEERLYKEQRRYQNSLRQASVGMTRIRNLRKLLDFIAHIITKTVRISYAAIYLYDSENGEYVLQVMRNRRKQAIINVKVDNPVIALISLKRAPLIYEEIKHLKEDAGQDTYTHVEENMRLLYASVIIPSFLEDRLTGFLILGEKLSGQMYTTEDLNIFQVLASQAALAIENAQFYEETKEMQEQITQAEKMATIGTMADGLSHQINNRFHALSLIAGDTIDTVKLMDTSSCSPELKDAIGQVNHALERIQANVMQGAQVVKGILKYSRRGEEGFEDLTLDQIIDGTLEMVQYKVKLSEIDILRNYSADNIRIKGNLTQLQEVFFNFFDNAYDSIVERRRLLKEDGYRGKITISAKQNNNAINISIEDNGMGIKGDDGKKIFTPFFTTKSSSRKGTGLGLYVIKKIVTVAHKGKISFVSEYKKGARFLLELPV